MSIVEMRAYQDRKIEVYFPANIERALGLIMVEAGYGSATADECEAMFQALIDMALPRAAELDGAEEILRSVIDHGLYLSELRDLLDK